MAHALACQIHQRALWLSKGMGFVRQDLRLLQTSFLSFACSLEENTTNGRKKKCAILDPRKVAFALQNDPQGRWPSHYPAQCPPSDARPASGTVYRFVNNDPPSAEDMRSWYEMDKKLGAETPEQICQARGISVFTACDDIRRARSRVPALRKYEFVAAGRLQQSSCSAHHFK